jgi:hypothetical protein
LYQGLAEDCSINGLVLWQKPPSISETTGRAAIDLQSRDLLCAPLDGVEQIVLMDG